MSAAGPPLPALSPPFRRPRTRRPLSRLVGSYALNPPPSPPSAAAFRCAGPPPGSPGPGVRGWRSCSCQRCRSHSRSSSAMSSSSANTQAVRFRASILRSLGPPLSLTLQAVRGLSPPLPLDHPSWGLGVAAPPSSCSSCGTRALSRLYQCDSWFFLNLSTASARSGWKGGTLCGVGMMKPSHSPSSSCAARTGCQFFEF